MSANIQFYEGIMSANIHFYEGITKNFPLFYWGMFTVSVSEFTYWHKKN